MDNNEFFFSKDIIKLNKYNDIAFSNLAQGAKITGAILPSGYKVPNHATWVIKDNYLINESFKSL
jgi:hypothetical protein